MGGCKRVVSSFQMTKKEGELEEEGREGGGRRAERERAKGKEDAGGGGRGR